MYRDACGDVDVPRVALVLENAVERLDPDASWHGWVIGKRLKFPVCSRNDCWAGLLPVCLPFLVERWEVFPAGQLAGRYTDLIVLRYLGVGLATLTTRKKIGRAVLFGRQPIERTFLDAVPVAVLTVTPGGQRRSILGYDSDLRGARREDRGYVRRVLRGKLFHSFALVAR